MNTSNGYIYIRTHASYEKYDACKLGKASNIPERDSQYATSEIERGQFADVYEVEKRYLHIIERLLQSEFQHLNVKYNAGVEFYNKQIIQLIEPALCRFRIAYQRLRPEEIDNLVRCNRVKKTLQKINQHELIQLLHKRTPSITDDLDHVCPVPRPYQTEIIQQSVTHFNTNDKGLLILMCGVGKTLISLWVMQKLQYTTAIIGVPNTQLLTQWNSEMVKLYQTTPYLIVSGSINVDTIEQFLRENSTKCIVITTYSSSHKVREATTRASFMFNIKILDEVHHLTTSCMQIEKTTKKYIEMLNIRSVKQLGLTATLKCLENVGGVSSKVVSNDNVDYFGEIIVKKDLLWAITNDIICDYAIQSFVTDEDKLEQYLGSFNIADDNDKRLFLSAYASLRSISEGHSHHLLVYSNTQEHSSKIIKYISMLLQNDTYFDISHLYYSNYDGNMKKSNQTNILNNFKNASFGIITCVYCLGEGWDFPLLDGVVFAENMSSNIRIVQSALRGCRKNKSEPNKLTKIILPILNRDDWLDNNENHDLKKVKEVIYQMGLEDENVMQKVKVYRIEIEKHVSHQHKQTSTNLVDEFGEYDDNLTQRLRLKTSKRVAIGITYKKAIQIVAEHNVKSLDDYYALCEKDKRLPTNPETTFKLQFNWIEYLSIPRVYYDIDTCRTKVREYILKYPELKTKLLNLPELNAELCKLDAMFPPNGLWIYYYNVHDIRDIINITMPTKKKNPLGL